MALAEIHEQAPELPQEPEKLVVVSETKIQELINASRLSFGEFAARAAIVALLLSTAILAVRTFVVDYALDETEDRADQQYEEKIAPLAAEAEGLANDAETLVNVVEDNGELLDIAPGAADDLINFLADVGALDDEEPETVCTDLSIMQPFGNGRIREVQTVPPVCVEVEG